MFKVVGVIFGLGLFFSISPGEVEGGPLLNLLRSRPGIIFRVKQCPGNCQGTCRLPELPDMGTPAPLPLLQESEKELIPGNTFSSGQDTVLAPLQGTGSRLLTGGPAKAEVTHSLDSGTSGLLGKLLAAVESVGKKPPSEVPIAFPLGEETRQRMLRTSGNLDTVLQLASAVLAIFGGGKLLQLVAPAVGGLLSIVSAIAKVKAEASKTPSPPAPLFDQIK